MHRMKWSEPIGQSLNVVTLGLLAVVMFFPLYYVFVVSFTDPGEYLQRKLYSFRNAGLLKPIRICYPRLPLHARWGTVHFWQPSARCAAWLYHPLWLMRCPRSDSTSEKY